MERAVHITKISDLKEIDGTISDYGRLYFGNEFCERLLPSQNDIKAVYDFAKEKNLKFSFVTPYVTDNGIEIIKEILDILNNLRQAEQSPGSFEVVVNDYGLLYLLQDKKYDSFTPVIGRVLNIMKTDPMISNLFNKMSEECRNYLRCSRLENSFTIHELKKLKVSRIEYNFPLHGINPQINRYALSGSVYYPYVFLSTTRLCMMRDCENLNQEFSFVINSCKRECQKYTLKLTNVNHLNTTFLKGNTHFYYNDLMEEDANKLETSGINRMVYQPKPPV